MSGAKPLASRLRCRFAPFIHRDERLATSTRARELLLQLQGDFLCARRCGIRFTNGILRCRLRLLNHCVRPLQRSPGVFQSFFQALVFSLQNNEAFPFARGGLLELGLQGNNSLTRSPMIFRGERRAAREVRLVAFPSFV